VDGNTQEGKKSGSEALKGCRKAFGESPQNPSTDRLPAVMRKWGGFFSPKSRIGVGLFYDFDAGGQAGILERQEGTAGIVLYIHP
jgi:hypothetical protein